uniref:Major facilitator superfamily (MFS) profile domain-containing protein n=1 Tax=Romanomermis culicivorax TaxID=13658 RepID=A0A915K1N8_ROMCU
MSWVFYSLSSIDENNYEKIVEEIQAETRNQAQDASGCSSYSNFIRGPFRLACFLWSNSALLGIGLVLAYSTDVFVDNGVPRNVAQWSSVAIGAGNILSSILAISLMETWGRKPLMITGLMGCLSSIAMYTAASWILRHYPNSRSASAYIVVPCLLFFILFFSLYNATSVTLAAEICPQLYRSAAISSGVFLNMTISSILILIYESVKEWLGYPWVFLPSSVISVLIGVYVGLAVPETKGRTLSELCQQLRN